MSRKDLVYTLGLVIVAALLLANLLRPGTPSAYSLPETPLPVSISSSGDSAWAVVGNKVYYFTLRPRAEVTNRIINQIDAQELR